MKDFHRINNQFRNICSTLASLTELSFHLLLLLSLSLDQSTLQPLETHFPCLNLQPGPPNILYIYIFGGLNWEHSNEIKELN